MHFIAVVEWIIMKKLNCGPYETPRGFNQGFRRQKELAENGKKYKLGKKILLLLTP